MRGCSSDFPETGAASASRRSAGTTIKIVTTCPQDDTLPPHCLPLLPAVRLALFLQPDSLDMGGWLPLRCTQGRLLPSRDLHPARIAKFAWRTNGLELSPAPARPGSSGELLGGSKAGSDNFTPQLRTIVAL